MVKYYLFDANGTNWEMLGSKNYIVKDTSTTKPDDVTSRTFPETKTVNGVTYKFSGWYTDENLTQRAPEFPAKVTGSVNYYANILQNIRFHITWQVENLVMIQLVQKKNIMQIQPLLLRKNLHVQVANL